MHVFRATIWDWLPRENIVSVSQQLLITCISPGNKALWDSLHVHWHVNWMITMPVLFRELYCGDFMDAVSLLYLEVFDFPYTLLIQVKYPFLSWEIMRNLGSKEGKKKMGREEWNCPKLTQSFSKLATIFFSCQPHFWTWWKALSCLYIFNFWNMPCT